MPNKVHVVPVIDTSYSMTYNKYVEATIIDSKAFLSKLLPKDHFAVARFDQSASIPYPTAGLAEVEPQRGSLRHAYRAIDTLQFTGDATDIGGGILAARGRLDAASDPRGIALLSDGRHNSGTDPLKPGVLPGYAVHACAMGPESDQPRMREIARRTGGRYLYMPRAIDLMKLLNEIRGTSPRTHVAHNELYALEHRNFHRVPVPVGGGNHRVHFGVAWESRQYRWGERVGPYTLAIYLEDPEGGVHDGAPIDHQPGFALFSIEDPRPGRWTVWIEYGGPKEVLATTVSAFEFQPEGGGAPELRVEEPGVLEAGQPLRLGIEAVEGERPVTDLAASVAVRRPLRSLAGAVEVYRDLVAGVGEVPEELRGGDLPEDQARLLAARRSLLDERDILPTVRLPVPTARAGSGALTATVADTRQAGSYTVEIRASGTSPVSGLPFARSRVLSVLVR